MSTFTICKAGLIEIKLHGVSSEPVIVFASYKTGVTDEIFDTSKKAIEKAAAGIGCSAAQTAGLVRQARDIAGKRAAISGPPFIYGR
jgi:hypothetical protein